MDHERRDGWARSSSAGSWARSPRSSPPAACACKATERRDHASRARGLRGRALLPRARRDEREREEPGGGRFVPAPAPFAMPIYEYRCPNGHVFELLQRMSDAPPEVCEVCGEAPVEQGALPGGDPLQGLGLLLDRLRPRRPQAGREGRSDSRLELGRRSKPAEKKTEKPAAKKPAEPSRLAPARPTKQPGANGRPGAGGCGALRPSNLRITLRVVLARDVTDVAADVAGCRRAGSAASVGRRARLRTHMTWRNWFAERSVASGLITSSPMNGMRRKVPRAGELVHDRLHDPLLALAARDVALARVELVLADRASR